MRGTGASRARPVTDDRFIPAHAGNRKYLAATAQTGLVHPRACGEQVYGGGATWTSYGSSPRMRGTGSVRLVRWEPIRFIPAHAGNRFRNTSGGLPGAVHPRACGEQPRIGMARIFGDGSSPRMRGTGPEEAKRVRRWRFIPAHAGNRTSGSQTPRPGSVHPRACGEQNSTSRATGICCGSSPRMRGTDYSPYEEMDQERFIPAHAGNSCRTRRQCHPVPVHPRACGEQYPPHLAVDVSLGSSPRMRGTGTDCREALWLSRFIPAHAGNSSENCLAFKHFTVHPRACGEQENRTVSPPENVGSSPRMRGTGPSPAALLQPMRFIPAHAGNRICGQSVSSRMTVHPRACGEQGGAVNEIAQNAGSSPRMRGTGTRSRHLGS